MILGSDISRWQAKYPAAYMDPATGATTLFSGLTFVVARATHDGGGVDAKFADHFHSVPAGAHRGAYHWLSPGDGSPVAQAALFVEQCIKAGFLPGKDLWMGDCEDASFGSDGRAWVAEWMSHCAAVLGGRGFLYSGWPFAEAHLGGATAAAAFLRGYNWWLPAYGPNDGRIHAYQAPFTPVVHQYTSRGGPGASSLDMNVVTDEARWVAIVGTPPQPHPTPSKPPQYHVGAELRSSRVRPYTIAGIKLGDDGNGWVPVPKGGTVQSIVVTGGSDPQDSHHYDRMPVAGKTSDGKFIKVQGGVPGGSYTLTGLLA